MKRIFILLTICLSLISNNVIAAGPLPLVAAGPGNRIHGVDISKWQHPYGKPINFVKMAKSGVRFVMIKGSDSQPTADAEAKKYLIEDRQAAQAAADRLGRQGPRGAAGLRGRGFPPPFSRTTTPTRRTRARRR